FRPGDWLMVEGQQLEVIEVNWRSTRLRSNDDIYSDVPNKSIVGATITNLTYLSRLHGKRITVRMEYASPPNLVKDCLKRAAANARGVLTTPAPQVFLKDFGEAGVVYEVRFWMDDPAKNNEIFDSVRTNIWYEAQRNHLRIPTPARTIQIERPAKRREEWIEQARAAAREHPFIQLLDEPQIERLLQTPSLLHFGRGERLIEQGAPGESMFILLTGEAEVRVRADGAETRVATLRAGDYCGEMSLLTGEPRSATIVARQDCQVWEIRKEMLAGILQENQAVVERLSDLLARHRMENEGLLASRTSQQISAKQEEYRASFLQKMFSYFEL
ncbi:MAG: cyclic nucleotide-binding domain-containing protein, partial [Chthoniobacteraceae bacterium]